MLGWLSGAAQRGAVQAPKDESGSPSVDEPPETPAPVFAVRAFKTALFGTPHPNQSEETVIETKASPEKSGKPKHSPRAKFLTPKTGNKVHTFRAQRATPLNSPAKGILLTPGTATTRRKTVSFGSLDNRLGAVEDGKEQGQQDVQSVIKDSEQLTVASSPQKDGAEEVPSLTKASFRAQLDASKQRLSERNLPAKSTTQGRLASNNAAQLERLSVQPDLGEIAADYTVDLTKPRSQSGQHWKAEFERYQQNSDRELKKVIQHGQNVKSYAEKKDVEATELQERLKRELVKCAAMETKVSKLATQLASSKKDGTVGSSEQEDLVNDLSRQTALAIKYKQKADRYRIAIQQQKSSSLGRNYDDEQDNAEDMTIDIISTGALVAADSTAGNSELSSLRAEFSALKLKLSIAEERTAKLEAMNSKLTKNFLRVKDEMNNYDARRIRKEARLKERADVLLAEKVACEAKFKLLSTEHEDLRRRLNEQPGSNSRRQPMLHSSLDRSDPKRKWTLPREHRPRLGEIVDSKDEELLKTSSPTDPKVLDDRRDKAPFKAPAIDILTTDTPSDTGDVTPSAAEPAINLSSIALSEATHEALREIDGNSVSENPSEPALPPDTPRPTLKHLATMDSYLQPDFPSSEPTSAAKRMTDRRNTIPSPRPSIVTMTSSTVRDSTKPPEASTTGWRRDANGISAAGSRTSTLKGGRNRSGELPPDRAAAAKARLAQKQSLKENRRT
ncbi:MAG: hypothetical protein LQ349_001171 [Xanthoria aureola]|nr:MAG: hypothetical protein LQ349_001171 [Xanthoria aureola]